MALCRTCPHTCSLEPGQIGRCRSRRGSEDDSSVEPRGYGRITSLALDPIEKKPIARWRPGTTVLSLGSYGCNMQCPFCQNASIAQVGWEDVDWSEYAPSEIVRTAQSMADRRCIGIAYTYNEPLVNWEFLRDTAELAHDAGLANVIVSNGMANEDIIDTLAPLIDAANIDLKCFTDEGYRALGGDFATVKRTIEVLAATSTCHLEVTTLVVPGLSDDEGQIEDAARWLASLDVAGGRTYGANSTGGVGGAGGASSLSSVGGAGGANRVGGAGSAGSVGGASGANRVGGASSVGNSGSAGGASSASIVGGVDGIGGASSASSVGGVGRAGGASSVGSFGSAAGIVDAGSSGSTAGIVYHLTRFFPRHRMRGVEPTPVDTLRRLQAVAQRHLDCVLLGNV